MEEGCDVVLLEEGVEVREAGVDLIWCQCTGKHKILEGEVGK